MQNQNDEIGQLMEEAATGGGTLIVDMATNYGWGFNSGIREVALTLLGVKLPLVQADFSAGATSERGASELAAFCFDTSLSLIGGSDFTSWTTPNGSAGAHSQRLYCNYIEKPTFDGIMINNWHASGTFTNVGANAVKIYFTPLDFPSIIFEEAVPGGALLFNGNFPQHPPTNTVQNFQLPLI